MSKIRRSGPALRSNPFHHSAPISTFRRFGVSSLRPFAGICTILRPLFSRNSDVTGHYRGSRPCSVEMAMPMSKQPSL